MALSCEQIHAVTTRMLDFKDMCEKLKKDQLYEKLRELYEEKTGEDRTHLDSVVGLNGKRKLRTYWRKDDYFFALALLDLDLQANMFEYWSW